MATAGLLLNLQRETGAHWRQSAAGSRMPGWASGESWCTVLARSRSCGTAVGDDTRAVVIAREGRHRRLWWMAGRHALRGSGQWPWAGFRDRAGTGIWMEAMMKWAATVTATLHVVGVLGFGVALEGYAMLQHPVALLGAIGVPRAQGFNLLALLLPGAVSVALAVQLLRTLPEAASRWSRVATQMLLLAGLAFVAMGLLPLDTADIDGPASRLHVGVWMLWI